MRSNRTQSRTNLNRKIANAALLRANNQQHQSTTAATTTITNTSNHQRPLRSEPTNQNQHQQPSQSSSSSSSSSGSDYSDDERFSDDDDIVELVMQDHLRQTNGNQADLDLTQNQRGGVSQQPLVREALIERSDDPQNGNGNGIQRLARTVRILSAHRRKKNLICPQCRAAVSTRPVQLYALKEVTDRLRRSETTSVLTNTAAATSTSHNNQANGSVNVALPSTNDAVEDRGDEKDLTWGKLFPDRSDGRPYERHFVMRDAEDGVRRCSRCAWEIGYDGLCQGCGEIYSDEEEDEDSEDGYYSSNNEQLSSEDMGTLYETDRSEDGSESDEVQVLGRHRYRIEDTEEESSSSSSSSQEEDDRFEGYRGSIRRLGDDGSSEFGLFEGGGRGQRTGLESSLTGGSFSSSGSLEDEGDSNASNLSSLSSGGRSVFGEDDDHEDSGDNGNEVLDEESNCSFVSSDY
ncbi:expressed protein [Phakopsora pachyrhizi]|uniref:Expressed protein n=1 Tax=Phakopsora pachyrhizi TaxID=170000 RepID=A0AAV0BFU3_PHAPC|nr:expressed protein [Phakopsora pachyrhizi]